VPQKPSALIDTRLIYCGEQRDAAPIFEQLRKLPAECVDLIYI
jgi:hypothetical protein